jgi:hypothetical protein
LGGCAGACTWTVGDIFTIAGTGASGYNGDGILATQAKVSPSVVALDSHGNVYMNDAGRLREEFLAITAPNAPRTPTAVPGNATATVRWVAPPINGGPAPTGYDVIPYIGTVAQTVRSFPTPALTEVVTGLTNGTAYTFRVRAKNTIGTGPLSFASAAIIVGSPIAPTAVKAVTGTADMNTGSITVTYTAGANNGAAITSFTASCTSGNGGVAKNGVHTGATAAAIVVSGVSTGKSYVCRVRATNSRGGSPLSLASAAFIVGAPAPPTGVHAVKTGSGQLSVSFVPGSDNGSPAYDFIASCTTAGGVNQTAFGSASPVVVTALTAGKSYTCTVLGVNLRGFGASSAASPAVVA